MSQIMPIEKLRSAIYCCYKGNCKACLYHNEENCFKKLLHIIDKIEKQLKEHENGNL